MTCLEFRRAVGADPGACTAEVLEHAAQCAGCARYLEEMQRMDRLLRRALEVDLPAANVPAKRRWLPRWAAAASVVFACVLGAALWLSAPRESLAEQLVAHLEHEPQALIETGGTVDPAELQDILARSRLRLKHDAGPVTYVESCWFRGDFVPHLVVQTEEGPVTLLVLPQEDDVEKRQTFKEGGYEGVLLPAPRGAVAVLSRGARAEQVAERFLQAVDYGS